MSFWDVERDVGELYDLGEAYPEDPISPLTLARRILGRENVIAVQPGDRSILIGDGAVMLMHGQWTLLYKAGMSAERTAFIVSHELAEWKLRSNRDPAIERMCNVLAAAIIMPRAALREAVRHFGEDDLPSLASHFCATQTATALRIAEAFRRPRAVVTRSFHWVRSFDDFVFPPEPVLRRWADGNPGPGVRKIRITDHPTPRFVLDVDTTMHGA